MDSRTRARITNALRALSRSWTGRSIAKAKRKVAPATYECDHCKVWIYEGKSKKSVEHICLELNKRVIMDRPHMDHNSPVVPLEGWDDYNHFKNSIIDRVFCDESNYNLLCPECHAKKTAEETQIRKKHRQSRKASKKKE